MFLVLKGEMKFSGDRKLRVDLIVFKYHKSYGYSVYFSTVDHKTGIAAKDMLVMLKEELLNQILGQWNADMSDSLIFVL